MSSRIRFTAKRVILAALVLAGMVLLALPIVALAGRVIGLSMFLVSVFFLPATLLVLGWFVFSVWGRPYLRAWHISRIRHARHLREAVERGRSQE